MTTLVVAAHPDDEVLGCGGTIASLSGVGTAVHIVILGEGITSRAESREGADQDELGRLATESRKAGQVLGARETTLLGFPDNRFDSVPLLDLVKAIERAIRRLQPTVIYTQHGGDLNIDHELTFRAVLTATRPLAGNTVREVLAFEVGSSTEWAFQRLHPVFRPNVFVDITATLEQKILALRSYASEMRPFPHPRSIEALRAQATRWGSTAGLMAAEAFELIRAVR